MDGMLQAPVATAFDAIASLVSLVVYLGVAVTILARRTGDVRARVFLVVALTSAVPYVLAMLQWWKGSGVYTLPTIALTAASFAIGSPALFHFTQVFPARRPWIRAHGRWLVAAYALLSIPTALMAWVVGGLLVAIQSDTEIGGLGAVSAGLSALALLGAIPVIVVIGVVLPFAGLMSLVSSWREAKRARNEPARETTSWMLVSQLGGGVLAILILPLLHMIGVRLIWSTLFGGLAYAFALIMPMAYYKSALNGDALESTPQRHNSATPN